MGPLMNRREFGLALAAAPIAGTSGAGARTGRDMIELSACDAVAAMRAGDVSAEAYADALLAKCAAGRDLNAFITQEPDQVREAARAADRLRDPAG